jgi:hypothetical protein
MAGWRCVVASCVLGSIACGEPTVWTHEDALDVRELGSMSVAHLGFATSRISAARGEDGRGGIIAATDPVALDVTAERFGARALDPVLHVGVVEFVHYSFPSKNMMRFVAADAAILVPGVEVWLQWGDDTRSRVVLTRSLEVPK